MNTVVQFATPISLALVGGVLVAGLLNMGRGGSANMSQQLMRWRVGLQFLALVIIMAALYVKQR
jgi:Hypoxia induced protein conserved region